MAIENYFTAITKKEKVSTSNGRGGSTTVWTTTQTFTGIINQSSSAQQITSDQKDKQHLQTPYTLFCELGVSLEIDDRVFQDNIGYRVTGTVKNTMHRNHHYKYTLERVNTDG